MIKTRRVALCGPLEVSAEAQKNPMWTRMMSRSKNELFEDPRVKSIDNLSVLERF